MSKNQTEIAVLATGPAGRFAGLSRAQAHSSAQPSPIQKMMAWYDEHGLLDNATTLRAILGREPRTLETYFEELKNAGTNA